MDPMGMTRPLRVGFNARLLSSETTRGWNRYLVSLLAELPALGAELFLYSHLPPHENHIRNLPSGAYQVRVSKPMTYLAWQEYWLPRQCREDALDIFHSPFHYGLPWRADCACVLTMHDAIGLHPLAPLLSPHVWAYHAMARARADHIVTISKYSCADLMRAFGIPKSRITVTYLAAHRAFHEITEGPGQKFPALCGATAPYVLYYGGWEERKNVPFLVRAFAATRAPGLQLVLAGGSDAERTAVRGLVDRLGIAGRVRLLGILDDADLPGLCAGALCFAYPSRHEGFGLQVCEAMAAGCPVLVARATSLPEVLGDGGASFSLDDPHELTQLLQRMASDTDWRATLSRKARERSHTFSWHTTAVKTLQEAYPLALRARQAKRS
jgi:glycosyltransferase involved in cell wall biosynthesis